MAFRFERKGKMSRQLRDIVREELDDALELLTGDGPTGSSLAPEEPSRARDRRRRRRLARLPA